MSFKYISEQYHIQDNDLPDPERSFRLGVLRSFLHGEFYDSLPYRYSQEQNDAGEYISMDDRAPSVTVGTNLVKTCVDQTVFNTFGEGHTPDVMTTNKDAQAILKDMIEESQLFDVMGQAVHSGSVGSVAIRVRVMDSRFVFDKMDTTFLTPVPDPDAPDRYLRFEEKYKVTGKALARLGYDIPEDNLKKMYWFMRWFTQTEELYFDPWLVNDEKWQDVLNKPHVPVRDDTRTKAHNLKYRDGTPRVNVVWIKNLHGGTGPDGGCSWKHALDICIAIDYSMSQGGRLLKYAADPMLVIKQPPAPAAIDGSTGLPVMAIAGTGGKRGPVKAPGGALRITAKDGGDAKLLQLDGDSAQAVIDYCKALEKGANKSMHANLVDPETIGAGPRGSQAMQIMNAPFAQLVGAIKTSYGERGLVPVLQMVLDIIASGVEVEVKGKRVPAAIGQVDDVKLRWPELYPATPADMQAKCAGLTAAITAGFISRQTAIAAIAVEFRITDVQAEELLIEADKQRDIQQASSLANAQVKLNVPT